MNQIQHTIEPIYNKQSQILILGSFPSVKSREAGFFYHHPQNRFWKVIASLTGQEVPLTVEEKKDMLLTNGIALWDVISSCEIKGSSDSSITNVVPADLSLILGKCNIKQIYINGNKAYDLYQKYCYPLTQIEALKLPSTSPANALKSLDKLVDEWKVMIPHLLIPIKALDEGIVSALLNWYDHNARILPWREESTPYRVWISEIMLQQTRVEAVKPYFDRFMNELPTVEDLAHVEADKLMKLWEGLGYYNRAKNLQKAALTIVDEYGGHLPADYDKLLTLCGIGDYTAGAIGSISYGLRVPAVDGNVLRVITRLVGSYLDILKPTTKKEVSARLTEILPMKRTGDFNQALMELGATICIPNGKPKCHECPWDTRCQAYKKDLISVIPVKAPKKPRKIEKKTVFILVHKGKIALHKRLDSGLLPGLWEFPNVEGDLNTMDVRKQLSSWDIKDYETRDILGGKHIFSHIEWNMSGYLVEIKGQKNDPDWIWVDIDEIKNDYAIPAAFEVFKKQLPSGSCT